MGGSDAVPKDYKAYCSTGVPKMIHVDSDRFEDHRRCLIAAAAIVTSANHLHYWLWMH